MTNESLPEYTWSQHPSDRTNRRFLCLNGKRKACVDTRELQGKGFLWSYGNRYGYAESIEAAKAWVEGLSDHYSLPPKKRWMTL